MPSKSRQENWRQHSDRRAGTSADCPLLAGPGDEAMNKPVPDEPPFRGMSELAARVFGPVAALTKIEMPGDIDARYRAFFHSAQSAIQAPDSGGDDVGYATATSGRRG